MPNPMPEPIIRIEFKFNEKQGLPSYVLTEVISCVEQALYRGQVEALEDLSEIPQLPQVAVDAARQRIQSCQGTSFIIKQAKSGSLILEGTFALLGLWLLDRTLSETLREAYREGTLHQKLKEVLQTSLSRERLDGTVAKIKDYLRRPWRHPRRLTLPTTDLPAIDVEVLVEGGITIKITVHPLPPDKIPPTGLATIED